jgi:hypothetical protein
MKWIESVCPGAIPGLSCLKPKPLVLEPVLPHPAGVVTFVIVTPEAAK